LTLSAEFVDFLTVDRLEHSDENIVFDEKKITEDNHEPCVCECVLCSIIDTLKNDKRKIKDWTRKTNNTISYIDRQHVVFRERHQRSGSGENLINDQRQEATFPFRIS
jgi:hypothetical protein